MEPSGGPGGGSNGGGPGGGPGGGVPQGAGAGVDCGSGGQAGGPVVGHGVGPPTPGAVTPVGSVSPPRSLMNGGGANGPFNCYSSITSMADSYRLVTH